LSFAARFLWRAGVIAVDNFGDLSIIRFGCHLLTAAAFALSGFAAANAATDHPVADATRDQNRTLVTKLLAQHADPNAPQGDGSTALHWAAHWDDVDTARALVAAGAKADAATDQGLTPLALAAFNGSAPMIDLLLKAGANPNRTSAVGETPLMRAAHVGSVASVERLLAAGAEIGARETTLGQTALMRAVAEDHADVVRLLIQRGADVNARSTNRFTPILFAAQQGNVEIAKLLLASGANVNDTAPDGVGGDTNALRTFKPDTEAAALLVAIDSNHEPMAQFLLGQGADPNHAGAGRTALHSAVQRAMPKLVEALLAKGADPNVRTTRPMPLLSRYIQQQTGLDVNPLGATPFWWASSYGDLQTMRLLIDWGADPWINAADGTTPLMVAAGVDFVEGQDKYGRRWFTLDTTVLQNRARDAVQFCLDLGLDINAANEKGQTALHGAVYFGGTTMVPFLVERGANMNAINARGQTPWLITQGEYQAGSFIEHKETGVVLQKLGADTTIGHDVGAEKVARTGAAR
jgi:ankyrin repeat protein